MFEFQGKVALVVGGAGYLATPICERLAQGGASVVVADIDEPKAATLARRLEAEYGSRAKALGLDAGDEASIQDGVAWVKDTFGGLDILVNASFSATSKSLDELSGDEFTKSAQVQLTGAFLLARAAANIMRDGGSILLFSSMYGRVSPDPGAYHAPMNPNPLEYGVTKAGIDQMVRYLAVHYAPRNIRVNGVAPGAFPNPAGAGENNGDFQGFIQRLSRKAPLGRVGRQHEVAGPVLFLVSDEASFITGQVLPIDGGWTIW